MKNLMFRNKKNILLFALAVCVGAAAAGLYTSLILKPSYSSFSQFSFVDSEHNGYFDWVRDVVKSNDTAKKVAESAKENNIKHADGSVVSADEISGGLTVTYVYRNPTINVLFSSSDFSICQPILERAMQISKDVAVQDYPTLSNLLIISSSAGVPQQKNQQVWFYYVAYPVFFCLLLLIVFKFKGKNFILYISESEEIPPHEQ